MLCCYPQAVYAFLEQSDTYHKSKVMADADLALLSTMLPRINYIPPSIHLLREVSGAKHWAAHEQHVCAAEDCPGHLYPPLPQTEWIHHLGEQCRHCGTPRFKTTHVGGGIMHLAVGLS